MSELTFGDRLDRWLLKRGFRAQWPLATLRCIETRRAAARPLAHLKRRSAVRAVTTGSRWARFIDRQTGYRLFAPDTFPELASVTQACREIFAAHAGEVTDTEAYNKRYFFNILSEDDLRRHRVLAEFALSPPVTEAVTGYLGMVPRFHSLGVFYSSINDTISGSQMYHVDGDALSQVKCFVSIWDVDRGSGAFTFVPKQLTSTRLRHGGLVKSLSDEDVARATPSGSLVEVVGAPGSGVFVDTSRCLHQGSRARERARLVFQFQYVSRPDALLARAPGKVVAGGHLLVTRRLIESLGLADDRALNFVE